MASEQLKEAKPPYLVAGLRASSLHGSQTIIVSRDGVVMLDALLGAALLVDFHQRQRRGVVLYQPHLRGHCHHSGHCRDEGKRRTFDRNNIKASPKRRNDRVA